MRHLLAALLVAASALVVQTGRAEARVTNCWHRDYYADALGNCMGRDANPPYTTQFALMLPCDNGTRTSGWKPAPYWTSAYVRCDQGHRRTGAAYFLFK